MGKGTTFDNDILKLIFTAVAIANIADNAASSPLTNLFVSLHTADPSAGTQNTSEIAYTSYARVTLARTAGAWTVTGNSVSPAADITFPTPTGAPGAVASFAAVGTLVSGAGKILYAGALAPNITISTGTPPIVKAGSTISET